MKKLLIGIIISLFPLGLIAVQRGSNSVVSLESLASFPAEDNDNEMLSFGYFKNGFTLQDNTTTCTFRSIFSVGGNVSLNGGQLFLGTDIHFESGTNFLSAGLYNGNGYYSADFASSIILARDVFPTIFYNISVTMHDDVVVTGSLTIQGNCIINGQNSKILLGDGGCIIVQPGSSLKLSNISIQGLKDDNIQCMDDTGLITLSNCNLGLSDAFDFAHGSISFNQNVSISGGDYFNYRSSMTSTIESASVLYMDIGTVFNYDPSTESSNLIQFADRSSTLYLNGATLASTSTGMQLSVGTLIVNGNVELRSQLEYDPVYATAYTTGFVIGDGLVSSNDLFIKILSSSQLNLRSGWMMYKNLTSQSFFNYDNSSVLKINQGSTFYLDTTLNMGLGIVKADATTSIIKNEGGDLIGNVLITV